MPYSKKKIYLSLSLSDNFLNLHFCWLDIIVCTHVGIDTYCLTLTGHDCANFHMQLESLKGTVFPYLCLNICESVCIHSNFKVEKLLHCSIPLLIYMFLHLASIGVSPILCINFTQFNQCFYYRKNVSKWKCFIPVIVWKCLVFVLNPIIGHYSLVVDKFSPNSGSLLSLMGCVLHSDLF